MLDALISAGANLLGNMMNKSSTEANNATQMAIANQNIALQKEFAKSGIQWKVEDAKAAGLHPLAALGANTSSFSPVSVGTEASKFDFSSMGQDLSRAAKAMSGETARAAVDAERERKLDLESKALDNDIKRAQLGSRQLSTSRAGGQLGPPVPVSTLPRGWEAIASGSRSPFRVSGIAAQDDDVKIKEVSSPSVKRMNLWGVYPLEMDPSVASGQDLENEFGEYGGGAMSLPNIPAHFYHDFRKNKWPAIRQYLPSIEYRRR